MESADIYNGSQWKVLRIMTSYYVQVMTLCINRKSFLPSVTWMDNDKSCGQWFFFQKQQRSILLQFTCKFFVIKTEPLCTC